ncbi:hypothetical protein ACH4TX_42570 [Streptomyces sp. NPDC021098]|uniref:hypothetical protein n=1 Tax=unclassified Streptomyces TaxID=2593676 RepID=UPI00378B1BB6
MSAHEPTALDDPRCDDRSPSMRDLLAACAAASAVSTPPEAPAEAAAPSLVEAQRDKPERDAA